MFLLCCHVQVTESAEFCPLAKPGIHCDKTEKAKDAERVTKQAADDGIDCCAFIPLFFDKTRTSDSHQQVAFVAPASIVLAPQLVAVNTLPKFRISHNISVVLLKNDTFLKNRTFRL